MSTRNYCTARQDVHSCHYEWDYGAHPGDATDHECHCEYGWVDQRYQKSQRPQLAYIVEEGAWNFSVALYNAIEIGPALNIWFGRRGIHLPFRWRPWKRS
jgi:hypothetical protein